MKMREIMTMTVYHVTPAENLPSIKAKGLYPQMGPRSEGLERDSVIHVFYDLASLEDAIQNWNLFDDDEELVCLEVRVAPDLIEDDPAYPGAVGLIRTVVPPSQITVMDIAL